LLNGEADAEAEYRIYDFQRTIEKLKQVFREKKEQQQLNPPVISEGDSEMEVAEETKKEATPTNNATSKKEDVEMTDEEDDRNKSANRKEKGLSRKYSLSKSKEVLLSAEENSNQQQEFINQDLEELIKANGEDIEYEFYYNGQLVGHNQTLFEILKMTTAQQQKELSRSQAQSYY
jgi:hypothetical protein